MQVRDPPVATAHSRRSGAHRWLLSLRWGEVAQVSSLPKHTPVVHKIQWWWLGRGFLGLRGSIPRNAGSRPSKAPLRRPVLLL